MTAAARRGGIALAAMLVAGLCAAPVAAQEATDGQGSDVQVDVGGVDIGGPDDGVEIVPNETVYPSGRSLWDDDPSTVLTHDGTDPVAAAVELSRLRYPDGGARLVTVARVDHAGDVVPAASLSAYGPLLLSPTRTLPDDVAAEITRVLASDGEVLLVGGQAALGPQVAADAAAACGCQVTRLAGHDRIGTALAVADEILRRGHPRQGPGFITREPLEAVIVRADGWADGLAAVSLAIRDGAPVLLTTSEGVAPEVAAWLDDWARQDRFVEGTIRTVTLVGGVNALQPGVVSDVERTLADLPRLVRRLAGPDRATTAAAVNDVARPEARGLVLNGDEGGWRLGAPALGAATRHGAGVWYAFDDHIPAATIDGLTPCVAIPTDVVVVSTYAATLAPRLEGLEPSC